MTQRQQGNSTVLVMATKTPEVVDQGFKFRQDPIKSDFDFGRLKQEKRQSSIIHEDMLYLSSSKVSNLITVIASREMNPSRSSPEWQIMVIESQMRHIPTHPTAKSSGHDKIVFTKHLQLHLLERKKN
jgi:hypothetical protein